MKLKNNQLDVHLRWLIRRDLPQVLEIESASYRDPWQEDDFLAYLRHRNVIGMVAESGDIERGFAVHGFVIYELHNTKLHIVNLAVHPESRLRGVGRKTLTRLKERLYEQRRSHIDVLIRESNVYAQRFFRACGFVAVEIQREHYDNGEDAYLMRYTLQTIGIEIQ